MKKEIRVISGLVGHAGLNPVAKAALNPPPAGPFNFRAEASRSLFGKPLKRALLAITMGGLVAAGAGCLSIHTHKEVDQPAPVVVTPPNPPPQ